MINKKILILSYSHLKSDPRIQRQIKALKDNFDIEVSGFSDSGDASISFFSIYSEPPFSMFRKLKRLFQFATRQYDLYYWDSGKKELVEKLKKRNYDLIIANDIQTLPLALEIGNPAGNVFFDAHEYHPKEFEDSFKWQLFHRPYTEYLCKKYIPKAAFFSTVCEGIAIEYEKYLEKKPVVITNAAYYADIIPSDVIDGQIKLIHHGAAIPGRQIENMIDVMKHLDNNYSLFLMLTGKGNLYYNELMKRASVYKNIFFIDPVPFDSIITEINKYDIGIYCLPPSNFNNHFALPNKFFEFIQARLSIVVTPNPEMAKLVKKYDLGVITKDYQSETMAKEIKQLSVKQITQFKKNANQAAKVLCAEENMKQINKIVSALVFK
jgi:hypothetical protein